MKKLAIIILTFCLFQFSYSQTNSFPPNGNVGIGTSSPERLLDIHGNHQNTRFRLFFNYGISSSSLDMWASEPGWSWNGSGIGNNVNGSPFYGRRQTDQGQSFIRFVDGSLYCYTGNADAALNLALNPNGNLGIGTSNPNSKLEVNEGNFRFSKVVSEGGSFGQIEWYQMHGAGQGLAASIDAYRAPGNWKKSSIIFNTSDDINLVERMRINYDGNIGIGTTNPARKLHVGTAALGSNADNNADILSSGGIIVNGKVSYDNSYFVHAYQCFQGPTGEKGFLSYGYYGHEFQTRQGSALVIRGDNNNVGIGTTIPQYKLAVKGTIGCGEVKVEDVTNWPDFVFKPNYNLRSLSEVEQFIKANNHLPEIPSEAEVKENGIGLGEMNAKLLQKVEELTLYLIEQQKRIQQLEQKLEIIANKQ